MRFDIFFFAFRHAHVDFGLAFARLELDYPCSPPFRSQSESWTCQFDNSVEFRTLSEVAGEFFDPACVSTCPC
jgi:hypothetical protein